MALGGQLAVKPGLTLLPQGRHLPSGAASGHSQPGVVTPWGPLTRRGDVGRLLEALLSVPFHLVRQKKCGKWCALLLGFLPGDGHGAHRSSAVPSSATRSGFPPPLRRGGCWKWGSMTAAMIPGSLDDFRSLKGNHYHIASAAHAVVFILFSQSLLLKLPFNFLFLGAKIRYLPSFNSISSH